MSIQASSRNGSGAGVYTTDPHDVEKRVLQLLVIPANCPCLTFPCW